MPDSDDICFSVVSTRRRQHPDPAMSCPRRVQTSCSCRGNSAWSPCYSGANSPSVRMHIAWLGFVSN